MAFCLKRYNYCLLVKRVIRHSTSNSKKFSEGGASFPLVVVDFFFSSSFFVVVVASRLLFFVSLSFFEVAIDVAHAGALVVVGLADGIVVLIFPLDPAVELVVFVDVGGVLVDEVGVFGSSGEAEVPDLEDLGQLGAVELVDTGGAVGVALSDVVRSETLVVHEEGALVVVFL